MREEVLIKIGEEEGRKGMKRREGEAAHPQNISTVDAYAVILKPIFIIIIIKSCNKSLSHATSMKRNRQ